VKKSLISTIIILLLIGIILVTFFVFKTPKSSTNNPIQQQNRARISWEFDNKSKNWRAFGNHQDCLEPLIFPAPVDVKLASGVLYPGQERGGDYKPHGGFRFDGLISNEVNIYAPMDGNLVEAARHTSGSEVQYALYFLDDCGIVYKLDHIRELTPKFAEILSKIPMGGENDTRTTKVGPSIFTKKGELIATKVGLEATKNVFVDFGVYDLRKSNGVDYSGRNYYNVEQYGGHALCWLNNLEEPAKSIVKNLPGADGQNGKKSDYCH